MSSDLKKRNVPFSPPDMTEAEANEVRDAILSGWITTGPRTKKLEKLVAEYVGAQKAVCLNSATACMEMVLHLLGVGPGDEVIVPAYTYSATASVVLHVGATPVFVDIQADRPEFDYEKLADAITERTKVITPVDLGGIVADYEKVFAIVQEKKALFHPSNEIQRMFNRVVVSADCAHSFGAECNGVKAGAIADFSSFSFHAVKNLTTAEGGALCWNIPFANQIVPKLIPPKTINGISTIPFVEHETWSDFLYRMSQLFSLHGQNKDALAKTKLGAWEYDIIGPWYKCNMTDVVAAIGLAQLDRYPAMLERRRTMIERYDQAFAELPVSVLKHYGPKKRSSGHLYICRLNDMDRNEVNEIIIKMAERGVACNVHYKPLPMMTAYKSLGVDIKNYPNAYAFFQNEITLPLNTRMTDDDQEYVIENFIACVKEVSRK